MGYGGSLADAGQSVGRSGDGGIDGIIKEDKLGLDVVCIQAKRWDKNNVGRPEVQAFAGSMEGFRTKKGVLITTSSFSKEAREYVTHIERKIVLIDGRDLADLMIEHNVGVETTRTLQLKRIDQDYFDENGKNNKVYLVETRDLRASHLRVKFALTIEDAARRTLLLTFMF